MVKHIFKPIREYSFAKNNKDYGYKTAINQGS